MVDMSITTFLCDHKQKKEKKEKKTLPMQHSLAHSLSVLVLYNRIT